MLYDSSYIRTDVTAVAIHNDLVLAGIGSSMYAYSANSTKPLFRLVCLNGQKIYGFRNRDSNASTFIVFGGKQFTIVVGPIRDRCEESIRFLRLFEPVLCDDWLHSVAWTIGSPNSVEVLVLTAHNVVQKYHPNTLKLISRHSSKDNSILYSGLLLPLQNDVLVMAGTVYSEVILHICGEDEPLHRLIGHKGVIFSISCNPAKNIIVTTSDDRSVRIWGLNSIPDEPWTMKEYWKNEIVCKHELYGHFARVMRSSITDTHIVSVGEDSLVCFWSHDGVIDKKFKRHQNAGIWSIDTRDQLLLTGGGDGAVTLQSLNTETNYHKSHSLQLKIDRPKQILYSKAQNLFILTEGHTFMYCNLKEGTLTGDRKHQEFKTLFHAISVSPRRHMCARVRGVAQGVYDIQIALEVRTRLDKHSIKFLTAKLEYEKILSVHWAGNEHVVACSEDGALTVLAVDKKTIDPWTIFELPSCKERWLTCAASESLKHLFVFGDRSGGIHLYKKGFKQPLKSLGKLHGQYGPTSMTISHGELITTGRDRTIKYFKLTEDVITQTRTKELEFHWVERFLDLDHKIVCGFKEKMFIVFNLRTNENLMKIPCYGGHRSWDAIYSYDKNNEQIELKLIFLKKNTINTELVKLKPPLSLSRGSQSKEINCLKTHQVDRRTVFVSGGEDTTLRLSTLDNNMVFEDIDIIKHLSSVRTLKIYSKSREEILVISAGGRAQICIKLYEFIKTSNKVEVRANDLIDYMLKGTDKERKGNNNWNSVFKDSDPETRIMDVDYIKNKENFTIFAGCSDARVRVFIFNSDKLSFTMIKESDYLPTCILRTVCVYFHTHDLLITCSTRGDVAFWQCTVNETDKFEPFLTVRTNKSGINSIATRILRDNRILLATGGDDNALHIKVLGLSDCHNLSSLQVQHSLVIDTHHSSAITGLCLVCDYLLTTSIDQRITLYKWKVTDKIECDFVYQTFSDVADIKGMEVIAQNSSSLSVCVFGKGIEVFDIPTAET